MDLQSQSFRTQQPVITSRRIISRKLAPWLVLSAGVIASMGCSICCPGYLDDYAAVGGKWQRSDPAYGRVGSPMSDSGSTSGQVIHDSMSNSTETIYESDSEGYYEDNGTSVDSTEEYEDGVVILGESW